MKVFWHTNIILEKFALALNANFSVYGGWMTGLLQMMPKDIELIVLFPHHTKIVQTGMIDGVTYYAIPKCFYQNDRKLFKTFQTILAKEKPDLVHIFGTEFPHALTLSKAFEHKNRTLIQLQGIVSKISQVYTYGLPKRIIYRFTLRDLIRRRNIYLQKLDFEKKGKYEVKAIQSVKYLIGRTQFDQQFSQQISPHASYHHINEILREPFYHHTWDIKKIDRFTIFIAQGNYPIKGLHLIFKSLSHLVETYPKIKVLVAGRKPFDDLTLKSKLKVDSYGLYIKTLIHKYKLENHVHFLGEIDEKAMVFTYLKSHVFLVPSVIENESNALSEAKILGVPTIASNVGGMTTRIKHMKDGLLYPLEDASTIETYIQMIFDDDQLAESLSKEAIKDGRVLFDKKTNLDRLLKLYQEVKSQ